MTPSGSSRNHASNDRKNESKHDTPHNRNTNNNTTNNKKDILSSRRHSLDYVTTDGVILRTGHADRKTWYLLCLKELFDNCIDFLWKYYQGAAVTDVTIETEITKTNDSMLHIKIRNTNRKNISVFQNLSAIFDFDMRYGSKQNQHIISRGMLGDAMKQILSWPYVLIHTTKEGNGNGFVDRQWDKPLIIRHNGLERHVFLHVDKGNQTINSDVRSAASIKKLSHTDTETELTWPIPDDIDLDIHDIERYCRLYPILTTDVSFKFRLIDNSRDKQYYTHYAHDIVDVLQQFKFNFNEYASARTKLPCIIVANLVSPRIDYHGHDKSRIDTAPFEQTILYTTRKVAEGIQTFQAAGWHFVSERKRELIASDADNKNITTEYLLTEFLKERMRGER